jgi:hypothetical protein
MMRAGSPIHVAGGLWVRQEAVLACVACSRPLDERSVVSVATVGFLVPDVAVGSFPCPNIVLLPIVDVLAAMTVQFALSIC